MPDQPSTHPMPVFQDFMNPMLEVLRTAGRPLPIEQLDQRILEAMQLPVDVTRVPHDAEKPDRSEVSYRIAWARTYLKKAGLLHNPKRGVWTVTDAGRAAGSVDARALAADIGKTGRPSDADTARIDENGGTPPGPNPDDDETSAARVAEALAAQLTTVHQQMVTDGTLLAQAAVEKFYARFREQFGPGVLAGLDGEALLKKLHGRKTKDSLVYWLEFKNDDEFPATFGSIGGGSSLKFGIYQSADTGRYMTGTGQALVTLPLEQAIAKAREQRDQLVEGSRILRSLDTDPTDVDYAELQARMTAAAPDLAEASWGHKYFSLIAPSLIEPFHGAEYQKFQLVKLLKAPAEGRYENARIFVGVAKQLGLTLYELGQVLVLRNGSPHGYWRVGTTEAGKSEWPRMKEGGFMAIGWDQLGDLTQLERTKSHKDHVRELMEKHYPSSNAAVVTKAANQVFAFVTRPQERDIVLAMEGTTVRGIGRISGDYYFQEGDGPFPHRRPVEWLRTNEWKLPKKEGLLTTFVPLQKHSQNLIEAEARLLGVPQKAVAAVSPSPSPSPRPSAPPPLPRFLARIQSILTRKRQLILYGPPGTGKTYWAERAARELAARSWFQTTSDALTDTDRATLDREGALEICAFHPAYGYEDFLEGHRPVSRNGSLAFDLRDGVFKRLCARATDHPKRNYYLIIDEINRGDIPRIFGELLTVLELDKRGKPITLPLSGQQLRVPSNVFVLGTMNTADRSIALLDAALRRRFGFIELMPDKTALGSAAVGGIPLGEWLNALNRRIVAHAGRDARNLQVGHSYLMPGGEPVTDLARFADLLRDDIIPLLEEYCYEDFGALAKILGSRIVQQQAQRINEDLFTAAARDDLAEAIRAEFDEITATAAAITAVSAEQGIDDDVMDDVIDDLTGDGTDDEPSEATAAD